MTLPTVYPSGYDGTTEDFLKAPGGQGMPDVPIRATVTVPASTTSGTVIGLIPFNKGASLEMDGVLTTADLDTSTNVTFTMGFVYSDNVTYTNDPDAFITTSTALQSAAANVVFNGTGGASFVAEADGWIAITTGGGSTTTEGTLYLNGCVTYERYS